MTAVEFFDEQLEEFAISVDPNTRSMVIHISFDEYINIRKQALEMEKQQMAKGILSIGEKPEITFLEISDEEIEKWAKEYTCEEYQKLIFDFENYDTYNDFVNGAKWYREQLKQKQTND